MGVGDNQLKNDARFESGYCVGTFRWKEDKLLPPIPPSAKTEIDFRKQNVRGWTPYLYARGGSSLIETAKKDLSMIDGLSFPLSLAYSLSLLDLNRTSLYCKHVNIVILGATFKAEIRLLNDSNYWQQLDNFFDKTTTLKLYFVGPEAFLKNSKQRNLIAREKKLSSNINTEIYQGTCYSFFNKKPELLEKKSNTILIGYNPGFGAGSKELLQSWLKDLRFIVGTKLPCIFTNANDYSDLRGELLVLRKILKVNFVIPPQRNAFNMAVTAIDEQKSSSAWSCGNSFLYAFQGGQSDNNSHEWNKMCETIANLCASFAREKKPTWALKDVVLSSSEMKAFTGFGQESHRITSPSTSKGKTTPVPVHDAIRPSLNQSHEPQESETKGESIWELE